LHDDAAANRRRAALMTVAIAAPFLVLLTVLGLLIGHVVIGLLLGLIGSAAVAAFLWSRSEPAVVQLIGAKPAEPTAYPRYHNLVEGLCAAAGLPKPDLLVVDHPTPDALAAGRSPRSAVLIVTTGLLDQLNRIELEGVLAHELSHVKSLDILPATLQVLVARTTGRRPPADPLREAKADRNGVSLTRYPPGLLSALEKVQAGGGTPPGPPATAHLWLDGVDSLGARIEALREL
jgi:heat shock protein HtpX